MPSENFLVRDLTALAKDESLSPIYGRDEEILALQEDLHQEGVRKILITGDSGAGKTSLVIGTAQKIVGSGTDPLSADSILDLHLNSLQADTVRINEELDSLLAELENDPRIALFVDSLGYLFDPELSKYATVKKVCRAILDGRISCIASADTEEVELLKRKNSEILSGFKVFPLKPLSENHTLKVLTDRRQQLSTDYGVDISSGAVRAAIDLTRQYMPNQAFPGKAVEVLEKACYRYRMKTQSKAAVPDWAVAASSMAHLGAKVSFYDVKRVVEEIAAVDITSDKAAQWTDEMAAWLNRRTFGQEDAIQRVASTLARIRLDFGKAGRPAGILLFAGPPGVGKRHTIRMLAQMMLQAEEDTSIFDMNEYDSKESLERLFGSIPGSRGDASNSHIFSAISEPPISIVVFRNIGTAHPLFFEIVSTIASTGMIRDYLGRKVSFKRTILLMCFDSQEWVAPNKDQADGMIDYASRFVPPSLARKLDGVIPFTPLDRDTLSAIVRFKIQEFQLSLQDPRPEFRIDKRVISLLVDYANSSDSGAGDLQADLAERLFLPVRKALENDNGLARPMVVVRLLDGEVQVALESTVQPR